DPDATDRFRREAQAIATLRHPNIVQIFDFGKYANGYFMVMEFIDGRDLAVLLRQTKQEQTMLPPEKIIAPSKKVPPPPTTPPTPPSSGFLTLANMPTATSW